MAGTAAGGSIPWAGLAVRTSFSPVSTNFYAYDTRGQVTNVAFSSSSDVYAYDSIGNRLSSSDLFGARLYDANAVNQYECVSNTVTADAAEPEYDLDGNLVSNGTFEYEWDARGRLVGVYGETPEGRPLELIYEYDWKNRLMGKRRRVREASGTWSEEIHEYLWDDWLLLHERIERADGTISNLEFVWGRDLSDTFQGDGGVGGLVAVSLDGYYYVPAYDDNGNVIAYFDESGAFAARYEYDAFGNALASSGPLADALPHRFSTKYFDPDLGLYYYGHRWYSPERGRWISRDPIEEDGGDNLYAFCRNFLHEFDPIGLSSEMIHVKVDYELWCMRKRTHPTSEAMGALAVQGLNTTPLVQNIQYEIQNGLGEQTLPCSKGSIHFRIMPHIGYPSDLQPHIQRGPSPVAPGGSSLTGVSGTYIFPKDPAYADVDLFGSSVDYGDEHYIVFRSPYKRYPKARFRVDRDIKVESETSIGFENHDRNLFTNWRSSFRSPVEQGNLTTTPVQCGDLVTIHVSNAATTEIDLKYRITD